MALTTYGDMNAMSMMSQGNWSERNALDQAANTVGAAVIDMGVSMWNSVANVATLGGYEDISTRSLLQDMGADGAIAAYDNNRDAVELLSFVGGVFIPGMAAVKISKGIRAGLKGTNFLSPVRHKEDLLKFENLVKDAQTATPQYKALKRDMFLRGQAENVMDNMAAEIAILGTFNAHPYMEDYLDDPVSNFGISMALGAGIGGGISALATRSEFAAIGGRVESAAMNQVAEAAQLYAVPYSDTVASITHMDLAAKNLDNIAKNETASGLVKEMSSSIASSIRTRISALVEENTGTAIYKMEDQAMREEILGRLKDVRMLGAEKMDFFTYKEPKVQSNSPFTKLKNAIFKTTEIDMETGSEVETFIKSTFYNPELGVFISKKDAQRLANAADRTDLKGIQAKASKLSIRQMTTDFNDTVLSGDGGAAEISYLSNLHFYSTKETPDLLSAEILGDDLAAQNGWVGAMRQRLAEREGKLSTLSPDDFKDSDSYFKELSTLNSEIKELQNAKLKVYSGQRVQLVNLEEVQSLPTASANPMELVKPTYFEDVTREVETGAVRPLVSPNWTGGEANIKSQFVASQNLSHNFYRYTMQESGKEYSKLTAKEIEYYSKRFVEFDSAKKFMAGMVDSDAQLSPSTQLLLARWIGGNAIDKELFRSAMASARTLRQGLDSSTAFHNELVEILNSPVTKQAQEAVKRHADAQGNMYLYRGIKGEVTGDVPVSSYTHSPKVATAFSGEDTIGMYKIHTDDVVGYLYNGEREWLVGASKRDYIDVNPDAIGASHINQLRQTKAAAFGGAKPSNAPTFATMSLQQAQDNLISKQVNGLQEAIAKGVPKEVASMQYNVPIEHMDMLSSPEAIKYMVDPKNNLKNGLSRWAVPNQVADALSPIRKQMTFTAQQSKIMGDTGALTEQHRQAILGQVQLKASQKARLESLPETEAAARLSSKVNIADEQFATINKLWVDTSVEASDSMLAKTLHRTVLDSQDIQVLREGLKEFVNGKGGNPLYSSADFVTSRMGDIGKLVTAISDKRVRATNQVFEGIIIPVTTQLKKLTTNEVARTEFAIFDNIRQSTRGFLRYDSELRTFVTAPAGASYDRKLGMFYTIEKKADGSTVKVKVQGQQATEYTVKDESVHMAMQNLQAAGDEVFNMQTTVNRVAGKAAPSDIGFWIPSNSLVNKHVGYVVSLDNNTVKMLVGNTDEELKGLQHAYEGERKLNNEVFYTRQELADSKLQVFEEDLEKITAADVSRQKKGIGLVVPDTDPQRLSDVVEGFRNRMNYQASALMENSMYDLTQKLDMISHYNRRATDAQGKQGFQSAVKQLGLKDTSKDVKSILLGHSQIGSQEAMGYVNKAASVAIHYGIQATAKAWSLVEPHIPGKAIDYDGYTSALKAQGIEDPFKVFNDTARPLLYEKAKLSIGNLNPDRVINASNALAATMALKFMELAQPLVNMLSLPVLMTSTISRSIKSASINSAGDVMASNPLAVMTGGVRRMNSQAPINKNYLRMATEEGLLDPMISEVDEVMKQARFGTGGAIGQIEKGLDSNFVRIMSKPSEWAEQQVRKAAFFTGVETAYRTYGTKVTEKQVMIFARDFMKQALGNYSTAQRPMMFQGTAGAAMGLFQTYMLTYAQNMYRHIDLKDYKGLGQTMLAQGGIFGAGSLPGFQPVSQLIGEHFSDDHIDFSTGLYRALPDELANVVMYGLPSNVAPALHTRGDVNPRIPTGFSTMVAPSMIAQMAQSFVDVGKAVMDQDRSTGQAFFEALSMQSVSRPIARLSELATGYSVTRQGNQIAGPEEVWSWQGILARTFSTRTLQESKAREAIHLNTYYGAINSENRQAVLETLRTNVRGESVTPQLLDDLAYEYMRTGSPQGFRQAVNQAFMEHSNDKIINLDSKLGNSSLMYLIDDLE
jgi:hypothetical protein